MTLHTTGAEPCTDVGSVGAHAGPILGDPSSSVSKLTAHSMPEHASLSFSRRGATSDVCNAHRAILCTIQDGFPHNRFVLF